MARQYIKKEQRQKSYNEIVALVKEELRKSKFEDDVYVNKTIPKPDDHKEYCGTEAAHDDEELILNRMHKELGWYYEDDNKHMDYCIKATDTEIWDYTLTVTLPKIRKRLKLKESPLEIIAKGANVSDFGDPVEWQKNERKDREI